MAQQQVYKKNSQLLAEFHLSPVPLLLYKVCVCVCACARASLQYCVSAGPTRVRFFFPLCGKAVDIKWYENKINENIDHHTSYIIATVTFDNMLFRLLLMLLFIPLSRSPPLLLLRSFRWKGSGDGAGCPITKVLVAEILLPPPICCCVLRQDFQPAM